MYLQLVEHNIGALNWNLSQQDEFDRWEVDMASSLSAPQSQSLDVLLQLSSPVAGGGVKL